MKDHEFSLRTRNNKSRLSMGYWFQGSDWYVFIPFYRRGDWKNKTKTIGFVIELDGEGKPKRNYLELAYQTEKNEKFLNFYDDLIEAFETKLDLTFTSSSKANHRYCYPTPNIYENLELFIDHQKRLIDSKIEAHELYP